MCECVKKSTKHQCANRFVESELQFYRVGSVRNYEGFGIFNKLTRSSALLPWMLEGDLGSLGQRHRTSRPIAIEVPEFTCALVTLWE